MNEKLTVVVYGQFSEVNKLCAECGSFHHQKSMGKDEFSGRRSRTTRRNARSVSARTPSKEVLEQVKRNADTDCNAQICAARAMQGSSGNWESFKEEFQKKKGKLSEWTLERLQEAYDKVASEDIGRLSIAQEILRKMTDFLRRIIAPVDGMGGVTMSHVCPHCSCFPLDDYNWWVSTGHEDGNHRKKKHCNWWCAACGGQHEWKAHNRILVVQLGANANEAKVFKAHAAPLGLCDNSTNALKLLAS